MAISIDWGTRIISVPRADMALLQSVPTEIRQLDLDAFRLALKDLEDSTAGMPFPDTHRHNTTVEVGGVILARVIEIINGYTVTFEDGAYAVNLVGANSNVGDVVNVNNVSVRSANSAGLQDLSTLLQSAYANQVCVDLINGQAGTSTPIGTRGRPVNNFDDARAIAENNSISVIQILSPATVANTDFGAGYTFRADSGVIQVDIEPSANVLGCTFENMTISGTLDGSNTFRQCAILDIEYVNGFIYQCALAGTITVGGGAQASILDCWSNIAGGGAGQSPEIDMGGFGNSLALRNYSGGIELRNYSGGGGVSLDMSSGRVVMDPTITAGEMTVRGVADVIDNSTGTAQIHDLTVNQSVGENFAVIQSIESALTDIESGYDAGELLRIILAAVAGKGGDNGSGTYRYRDMADTKDRIVATTDGQGNRTSVTVDGA